MGSAGSNESALSFYLRAPRVGAVPRVCPNSCLCCPCCFQIIRIKTTNTTDDNISVGLLFRTGRHRSLPLRLEFPTHYSFIFFPIILICFQQIIHRRIFLSTFPIPLLLFSLFSSFLGKITANYT